MARRGHVIAAVGTVGGGEVAGRLLSLVRMAIMGHMLSPDDFGIGATFVMTMAFAEMLTDFGFEKVIVQARRGDRAHFQMTVQAMLVIRGLLLGAVLAALAGPIATGLFRVPQARWAFYVVALIPLIRGLTHVDYLRRQRNLQFGPTVALQVLPELVPAIAAWPMLAWLGSYAAVVWLVLGKALTHVIVSHVVATRPYGIGWSRAAFRYVLSFGGPLVANGVLLYGVFHGDRIIIGGMLTMTDLGLYTAALTLAQAPRVFASRLVATVGLPVLSRHQDDREAFHQKYGLMAIVCATLASGMIATLVVAGEPLLRLVFGADYVAAHVAFGWLLAMQGVRLLRVAPNFGSMALGDTRNVLISNVFRVTALAGVVVAIKWGGGMAWVAAIGFAAEVMAYLAGVYLLASRWGVAAGACLRPALFGSIWPILAVLILVLMPASGWVIAGPLAVLMGLAVVGSMLAAFPQARREAAFVLQLLRRRMAVDVSNS